MKMSFPASEKRNADVLSTPKAKKTKQTNNTNQLERIVHQSKLNSMKLLERCLRSHRVSDAEQHELMNELHQALQLPGHAGGDDTGNDDDNQYKSKGRKQRTERNSKNNNRDLVDEHNEFCQVCDKGGDLLCCDSCTLVFHVPCVRPKLQGIPFITVQLHRFIYNTNINIK